MKDTAIFSSVLRVKLKPERKPLGKESVQLWEGAALLWHMNVFSFLKHWVTCGVFAADERRVELSQLPRLRGAVPGSP